MPDVLKVLGQAAMSATTLSPIYTVPAATSTIVRAITVCNRSGTPTTYRLSIAVAGAADALGQYIHYDVPIGGNETHFVELALSLAATDVLRAYAGAATLSIGAFGLEIS